MFTFIFNRSERLSSQEQVGNVRLVLIRNSAKLVNKNLVDDKN